MGETRHRNIALYRRGDDRDCLSVAVRKRFHFAGVHYRRSRGGLACGLTSRSETAIQGWGETRIFQYVILRPGGDRNRRFDLALFDYQLWQRQNAQLLLAILGSFLSPVALDAARDGMAQQAAKPFQWYLFLIQLVGSAIFCGIFGTLFGLLGVKVFRPRDLR